MAKFMLSLRDESFQNLTTEAEQRGISVQELLRAVIIPDWVKQTSYAKSVKAASLTMPKPQFPNGDHNGNNVYSNNNYGSSGLRDKYSRTLDNARKLERNLAEQIIG